MTKMSATEEWKCVLNYVAEVSLVFFVFVVQISLRFSQM